MTNNRYMGPSLSQSLTYESVGNREDYSQILTNISPDLTFFLKNMKTAPRAQALEFGWMTEGLRPPQMNAHLEKSDYACGKVGSVEAKKNYCQHFINSGWVSDAQRHVQKLYNEPDELAHQIMNALKEQAHDIEYMLVNGDTARAESGDLPALSGGIPYFMQSESLSATLDTTTGKVTAASAHNLSTGDFVYFTADTMPTGLTAGTIYYIRTDETLPDTVFTLFASMKDAVENKTDKQVKPTSKGTNLTIVKNNIIDLGGKADFTVDDVNTVMQMCYNRGGNPTDAVMSGAKKRRFSEIMSGLTTTMRSAGDDRVDMVVSTYQSDFGVINAHSHRLYPDDRVDLLDMKYWEQKWFQDSQPIKNLQKNGSYERFAIEAWVGLQGTQPKASGSIVNLLR